MNNKEPNDYRLNEFVDILKNTFPDLELEPSTHSFINDLQKKFGEPKKKSETNKVDYIFTYENHEIAIIEIQGLPTELIITTFPISKVNCPNPRVLGAGVVSQWGVETYNVWVNLLIPWWGVWLVLGLRDSIWKSINNTIALKKRALCPGCVAPCTCIVNSGQDQMTCAGVYSYLLWFIPWKRWVTCSATKSYAIMCI